MIELTLSIIACALLIISFKIFEKVGISAFQAIVINYGVAAFIGYFYHKNSNTLFLHFNETWFLNGCILGLVFMGNFYIMAKSTEKIGASVTSVASKMSLVITVMFGILYFQENVNILKIIAVFLALASVFLIIQIETTAVNKKFIFLPIILFFAGGFVDISLNYNQQVYLKNGESGLFSTITFISAFVLGLIILIYRLVTKKEQLKFKNIIGGIVLGAVNWLSIYFLFAALKNTHFDSSTIYTIANIGILLLVVVCGVLIFREKLNKKQWIGIMLALLAIILVSIA